MEAQKSQIEKRPQSVETIQCLSRLGSQQRLPKKGLSRRQTEIARLVAMGLSDKEIANELGLTEATIGWFLSEIFKKWQIHSRVALTTCFLREAAEARDPALTNVRVAMVQQ